MKVRLIQNVIAPYREQLFKCIYKHKNIDFKVYLLTDKMANYTKWKRDLTEYEFPVERVNGFKLQIKYDAVICINPNLILKIFEEKPDVVICAGYSFATIITMLCKFILGIKYVIWMEGTLESEKTLKMLSPLRKIIMKHAATYIDAGTMSNQYMKTLIKTTQKEFFRAYNCIETDRFSPPKENLREESSIEYNKRIISVAQLVSGKGINYLLESFKMVSNSIANNCQLTLIGEGPLRKEIEQFCQKNQLNNVKLRGFIEYRQMPEEYWNSDVFVLLSLVDRNPLVLFEALTAGLPIVISNKAGNAQDFVINGRNGYIVDPTRVDEISLKILDILSWSKPKRFEALALSRILLKKASYDRAAEAFVTASKYAKNSSI